jgi:tetratricopeptide (TPR) repeat protein
VDCYFDRAFRFAPDDGLVRMIYGVYLSRTNRKRDAIKAFEDAKKYEPTNSNVYYNLGLTYLDVKDYANALRNAQIAYRLGAPLPGLRTRLKEAGQWREESPGSVEGDPKVSRDAATKP